MEATFYSFEVSFPLEVFITYNISSWIYRESFDDFHLSIWYFVLEIYVRHYFDNLLFIAKNIIAKYALLIHCISADSLYLLALPWFCDASTAFSILLFKQTDGNIYGIYKLYMHIIREPLVSYQGLLKATPNNQQNTILNYLSYPS